MKIAILGLTAASYGSHTYLKNLLPHLAKLDRTNQYEVFLPPTSAKELEVKQENFHIHTPANAPQGGAMRVAWEQLIFPQILRRERVNAIYTTQNMAILLSSKPNIIIIQNVEPFFAGDFPNPFPMRVRLWLIRMMTELSLRRSRAIIAISEWERDFLLERFRLPAEKIVVSYPGVTEGFSPPAEGSARVLRGRLNLEPPYILSVTRLAGYGNLRNLAKAYISLVKAAKVTMPLVVPGEVWDTQYITSVKKLLADEGCAERVKFIGYVPHGDMPLLFGNATCFVFPSLLEACGTVLIEALACGTPILCSHRRPMSDICGDAAVLFDGEDPSDIAARLHEVLASASLRSSLSAKAVVQARQFSWQRGAEKVYRLLQQLTPGVATPGSETAPPGRRL